MIDRVSGYKIYTKHEYLATLTQRVKSAGSNSRILLMTMAFEPSEPEILELWDSLLSAARRGARIIVGIDARSFLDNDGQPDPVWYRSSKLGPLWFHGELSENLRPPYKARFECIKQLRAFPNALVVVTNRPNRQFSLPVAGRSHIKIALIDDEIFIGGCNLSNMGFVDPMISWHDSMVADDLYALLTCCLKSGNIRRGLAESDQTIVVNKDTSIYFDAGSPGQSIIYDAALQLIDAARDWLTITCQYFPGGRTGQHLQQAIQRGVKVKILFSHPKHQGLLGGWAQRFGLLLERNKLPTAMFSGMETADRPLIHAKVIACDGGVMIGSHNYVNAGVRLGTAEIALESIDDVSNTHVNFDIAEDLLG